MKRKPNRPYSYMTEKKIHFILSSKSKFIYIKELPVRKFYGVGKVTAAKMERMYIHTGADLKKLSKAEFKL